MGWIRMAEWISNIISNYKQFQHISNPMQQSKEDILDRLRLKLQLKDTVARWRKFCKKSHHRYLILKQWSETEQSYIKDLNTIQECIQKPLRANKLISQQEQLFLFPDLQSMLLLSNQLALQIRDILQNWNPIKTMIGEKLIYFHKFFMIYRVYCNNFLKGQAIIKEIRKKGGEDAERIESTLKMDFQSYIIKPVQRPPKYQLLLREYQKALYVSHPDYAFLTTAISKYHQVNELNNQSMDRQIRDEKMIELERKYSGVIGSRSGRVYLSEIDVETWGGKCKCYIFNDLILIIRKNEKDNSQEGIYERVSLNGYSFIFDKPDGKYHRNRVYLQGTHIGLYFVFGSMADKSHAITLISSILRQLGQNESQRRQLAQEMQTKRRNLSKFRVYAYDQLEVRYMPRCRVEVDGVDVIGEETWYMIRWYGLGNHLIGQTLPMRYHVAIQLREYFSQKYPMLHLPFLTPISTFSSSRPSTKSLQWKSMELELFLNFLLHRDELWQDWSIIANRVGLNIWMWKWMSREMPECNCQRCGEVGDNLKIEEYEGWMKKIIEQKGQKAKQSKQRFSEKITDKSKDGSALQKTKSESTARKYSQSMGHHILSNEPCPFIGFNLQHSISLLQYSSSFSFNQSLLYMQATLGILPYSSLLSSDAKNSSSQNEQVYNLLIYLPSLNPLAITIPGIPAHFTAREILLEVAKIHEIADGMADFVMEVEMENGGRMISHDQRIKDIITRYNIELAEQNNCEQLRDSNQHNSNTNSSGILKRFEDFKKWGSELLSTKKSKLLLRKLLFFSLPQQLQSIQASPQRCYFLIPHVFSAFRVGTLKLSFELSIEMCAHYYTIVQWNRLDNLQEGNFMEQKLKGLVDDRLIIDKQGIRTIFRKVRQNWAEVKQNANRANLIQLIHLKILRMALPHMQSIVIPVRNHTPQSLPASSYILTLSLSSTHLLVSNSVGQISSRANSSLLKILLLTMKYKITPFSIFIYHENKEYRFDGDGMYWVGKVIQMYEKTVGAGGGSRKKIFDRLDSTSSD